MKKTNIRLIAALLLLLVGCALLFLSCDEQPTDPCAAGHTEVTDAAVAASCTAKGLSEGKHCAVCNKILTAQQPTDKVAHTPGEWTLTLAADCNGAGSQYRKCTACDSILETQTIEAGAHLYGEWQVQSDATCTKTGVKTRVCTLCEDTQSESIPALGHQNGTWQPDPAHPANCLQQGLELLNCTRCNTVLNVRKTAALGHSFGDFTTVFAATCTAAGKQARTCTRCAFTETQPLPLAAHAYGAPVVLVSAICGKEGSQKEVCTVCADQRLTTIPELKHAFADWSIVTPATCQLAGMKERACTNAGCEERVVEIIPALGDHTALSWITAQEPSCDAPGVKHQKCSVCNTITDTEVIEKLEHAFTDWQTETDADCASSGLKTRRCTNAGCDLTQSEIIPLKAHAALAWITDREPTCNNPGTRHQVCTDCNTVTALDGIAKADHVFTAWETTLNAGCTYEGERVRRCTNEDCEVTEFERIPVTEHTYLDWVIDMEASCVNKGIKHRDCGVCEQTVEVVTIDLLPHAYPAYEVTLQPRCDATGEQIRTCPDCKNVDKQTIPPLEHTPGEWKTVLEVTPTSDGSKMLECTVCRNTIAIEIVPATGAPRVFFYTVSDGKATLTGYTDIAEAALVIPETLGGYPVTKIAAGAFLNATRFTSITLPATLEEIEAGAFEGCTALTTTDGLTTLGDWLILADPTSVELTLPATIKKIANGALTGCRKLICVTNLTSLSLDGFLPQNVGLEVRTDTETAFQNTLTTVSGCVIYTVGSVKYLFAYTGISQTLDLTNVAINAIYPYALAGNTTVRDLVIPTHIADIGENAFTGCRIETLRATVDGVGHVPTTHLRSLTVTGSPIEIPSNFLSDCATLEDLVLPTTVLVARKQAFEGCVNIKTLACSAEILSKELAQNLSSLVSLYVNGGTVVTNNVFHNTSSLKQVTFAPSVTTISGQAFFNCKTLEKVVFENGSRLQTIKANAFCSTPLSSINLPEGLVTIGAQCFSSCTKLTAIEIPNTVKTIEYEAFQNCSGLTAITIPASVEILGNYADNNIRGVFENCTSLKTVTFATGSKLKMISNYCFNGCKALTSITIPQSVTSIGLRAFENSGVTSVTFENQSGWKLYSITDVKNQVLSNGFQNLGTGTAVTVTNAATNASNFKGTNKNYVWKRG